MDVHSQISTRVQFLRKRRGYSLESLAERSGVSRSTISLIERGETSPTAVVLDKLASALGVTLAGLFGEATEVAISAPLARRADQLAWQDPASGYIRRNISPSGFPSSIELVEVIFPAGQRVAFDTLARPVETHEQVWVLEGCIEISLGEDSWTLQEGDCLALRLDRPIMFHNPGKQQARYLVALNAIAAKVF